MIAAITSKICHHFKFGLIFIYLKLHRHRLRFRTGFVYAKEIFFGKAEERSKDASRKLLDFSVIVAGSAVVEAAGGLDFVFGVCKVALQLHKVLVGL